MASYNATSGGAVTLDYATAEVWGVTLTSDCTITLAGAINGTASPITAILMQDATGGRTVTWPASVTWEGGQAPLINSNANESTVVTVFTVDGGTSWVGFVDQKENLPHTANTYLRRNTANDGFAAKTPQNVADEISPLLLAGPYMTYGGTADAVTLTSANQEPITALKVGMQLRFRATAENTGAMTINPDGLGAITVKTITGVDTPADYIRTDVDTVVTYDGTNLVADRQIERGSNANGEYVRFADGTQLCWFLAPNFTSDTSSNATQGLTIYRQSATWTFPAVFSGAPDAFCAGNQGGGENLDTWHTYGEVASSIGYDAESLTSFSSRNSTEVRLFAAGRWY